MRSGKKDFLFESSGSCYSLSPKPQSRAESANYCNSQGGHLGVLRAPAESATVYEGLLREGTQPSWLGLHRIRNSADFSYSTGGSFFGTAWDKNEPETQNCAYQDTPEPNFIPRGVYGLGWRSADCEEAK